MATTLTDHILTTAPMFTTDRTISRITIIGHPHIITDTTDRTAIGGVGRDKEDGDEENLFRPRAGRIGRHVGRLLRV